VLIACLGNLKDERGRPRHIGDGLTESSHGRAHLHSAGTTMFSLQASHSFDDHLGFDPSTMSRLLGALMDRIECGVMACGPEGQLYHANVAARRELAVASVLRLSHGRVECPMGGPEAWHSALYAAAVRLRSSLISLGQGEQRLMLALTPVQIGAGDQPAAVVMMGRRALCSPLGLEMLSNSHGLTSAERRVLQALIDNRSVREIAESHGVTVATVRTQIQAAREKLGVRSIDALLLRAAEVPPVTARH